MKPQSKTVKTINPKAEQKLPYDIIEFVKDKFIVGRPVRGDEIEIVCNPYVEWNGNSDDVKQIRKMIKEVYGK